MQATQMQGSKDVTATRRNLHQNASMAVRDVYDAIVELVTNPDDRYQRLKDTGRLDRPGEIHIEVIRARKGQSKILIRDFADGMTAEDMDLKLAKMGERVSGLEGGHRVRGTNSRGAKDVAVLGKVSFESIAEDGQFHQCVITGRLKFTLLPSQPVTLSVRKRLGIPKGTGTVVTIDVDKRYPLPQHDTLRQIIPDLVQLQDLLRSPDRRIILRDLTKKREHELHAHVYEGKRLVSETLYVPGFEGVTAKLTIFRSKKRFEGGGPLPVRARRGGILIKSKHAVHQATLFDAALESDPHAQWFYGRLVCDFIDDLCVDWDERFHKDLPPTTENPILILDPNRKAGLTREHPFVKSLFGEALRKLRPLVDQERRSAEGQRTALESKATRGRLDKLEKAAMAFMDEQEEVEVSTDPSDPVAGSPFRERGYSLSPPFTKMVKGHSRKYWLNVHQARFPAVELGETVQIRALSQDISVPQFSILEKHANQAGVLQALFSIKAEVATPATGLQVRVGPIVTDATLEVVESEADLYADVTELKFKRKRYTIRSDNGRKHVQVFAPIEQVPEPRRLEVTIDRAGLKVVGECKLVPKPRFGVAVADFRLKTNGATEGRTFSVRASLGESVAETQVVVEAPPGAGISIKFEEIDLENQRYQWIGNVIEIAALHPSLRRYLGSKAEGFKGQDDKHFCVLLAEIVADAVCSETLRHKIKQAPFDWEGQDWDSYYMEWSKLLTKFLPTAHEIVVPDA